MQVIEENDKMVNYQPDWHGPKERGKLLRSVSKYLNRPEAKPLTNGQEEGIDEQKKTVKTYPTHEDEEAGMRDLGFVHDKPKQPANRKDGKVAEEKIEPSLSAGIL